MKTNRYFALCLAVVLATAGMADAASRYFRIRIPLWNLDFVVRIDEVPAEVDAPPPPVEPPPADPEPPVEPPADPPVDPPVDPPAEPEPDPEPTDPPAPPPVDPPVPPVEPQPEEPPPAPEPVAYPGPVATSYVVKAAHPRLMWDNNKAGRHVLVAKLIDRVKTGAAATKLTHDRLLCRAILYRLGHGPADTAVADLLASTPSNGDVHFDIAKIQPVALGYDWLHDALSEQERVALQQRLNDWLKARPASIWQGYNYPPGAGMICALAINGEVETDWVTVYWRDNWWNPKSGFRNREYERNWQGGGFSEGATYGGDQAMAPVMRACWETATGDKDSLRYEWMDFVPLYVLHNAHPGTLDTGSYFSLPFFAYQAESFAGEDYTYIIDAGTGNPIPEVAHVSAWLTKKMPNRKRYSAAMEFIYRVLIGDPRTEPKSPAELGLPLRWTTTKANYLVDRTDWTPDATVMFFGAQQTPTRTFPSGDVFLMHKGKVLLGARDGIYRHHYGTGFVRNRIQIGGASIYKGDSTAERVVRAAFTVGGSGACADMTGLYQGTGVKHCYRSVEFDKASRSLIVEDQAQVVGVGPVRITWNTPDLPVIENGTVLLNNGGVKARMTFDPAPVEIKVVGGYPTGTTNAEEALANPSFPFGRDYDGAISDQDTKDKFQAWLKLSREQQLRAGGYFTIWVTPAMTAGKCRQTTTVQVE